jgi:acyl-CoA dehydrogenase
MPQEFEDLLAVFDYYKKTDPANFTEYDDHTELDSPFACEDCDEVGGPIKAVADERRRFLWQCMQEGCEHQGGALEFVHRITGGQGEISRERRDELLDDFDSIFTQQSFAEVAFTLAGKSTEEAKSMGAVDQTDDQVDALFDPKYQTVSSPVHTLVWDREFPIEMFETKDVLPDDDCAKVMADSFEVVNRYNKYDEKLGEDGKVSTQLMTELGHAGYWGMLVDKEYGGSGAPMRVFEPFLTRMATKNPNVAMLASVHGCIGAVDPIRTFGTDQQKKAFLHSLATGQRLSGFALTEPNSGSDLTALRTKAKLDGDEYVINGEKFLITNVIPGHTAVVVCMIDDKPSALIADMPDEENEHFSLERYKLTALKRLNNHGLVFNDFRVPKENLIEPSRGDGLTVAYHGLNYGRVSIASLASGAMRQMLVDTVPWAKFRFTYGQPIIKRELVEKRLGEMAGRVVATDAMRDWCSRLLDEGYRGEMECIIAKNFGAEALKYCATEPFMRTHGGRSFMLDHQFSQNICEWLAPSIYEGERDMLSMGFFKSLVKQHGKEFFEPIGKGIQERLGGKFNPKNPVHLWKMRKELWNYAKWRFAERKERPEAKIPEYVLQNKHLANHARFAIENLQESAGKISAMMQKHQLKLADRQLAMVRISKKVQSLVVMLVTSLYGAKHGAKDETILRAAETMCDELKRTVTHQEETTKEDRDITDLGCLIADEGSSLIEGIEPNEILMKYDQ